MLKFAGRHRLAGVLGRYAFKRCVESGWLGVPDAVVAVPLHPRRLRQRGYNQAALLARAVARCLGARMAPRVLRKLKDRPPQAELGAAARWRNAAGCYAARLPSELVEGELLLVDDVMTTGATAEACARALLAAGARAVDVLTVARAV